ncbi:MAG: class IV adenylate cyclase [Thermococcus sp.]|nr:class IV adenylate cyclase [Thermococcus sp.]
MEIEVKFRVDFEEIERKLKSLGAKLVRVEEQEDLYFSLPSNELLRIRWIRNLGKSFLTYKLIKDPGRNEEFDEIEVEVSSFEKAREILKRLGFREDILIRKHRLVYKLNDVTFELSNVENIGSFLDIEVISDSPDEAKKKIWALAEKLGLTERDVEPRLYTELIKEKSR